MQRSCFVSPWAPYGTEPAVLVSPAGPPLPARLSRVDTGARNGRAACGVWLTVAAAAACAGARPSRGGDSATRSVCQKGGRVLLPSVPRAQRRLWRSRTSLLVGSADTDAEGRKSPARTSPEKETIARRALLFGLSQSALLAPAAARADDLLETAGQLVGVLKPLYKLEAPLQAGSYDKAAVRAQIQEDIKSSQVVVYSYTLSPFCTEAKQLLEEQGAKVKAIELGPEWLPGLLPAEGAAIRAELGAMTGQTSMPHIFIGGTSIGGLATGTPGLKPLLKSGRLSEMLKGAGAI